MAGRGKKDCPNCNTELGARTSLCQCGYHFPSKEVRTDLLEEKNSQVKTPKFYSEGGPGRKKCTECGVFIAAVSRACPKCDYEFPKKEKKQKKIPVLKVSPKKVVVNKVPDSSSFSESQRLLSREVKDVDAEIYREIHMTPDEHAEKILGYGVERATSLFNLHRWGASWSHVNWKKVEEGLNNIKNG